MRKALFYIIGVLWMVTAILSLNCVGEAEIAEQFSQTVICYLKAVAWGGVSFLLLGVTTHLAWEVD